MAKKELDKDLTYLIVDMTQLKPNLVLNRLIITSRGRIVYDEIFHLGVNIIRGENSSGKSTIADFIFFALGGDFTQWKPEALRCDLVLAEVSINGEALTIRRQVSEERGQPLEIYWGTYEEANASMLSGWQKFPYARTVNKDSFSQVIFRALGFPEVTGDKDANITMHQILRLLAVDQLSRPHSLMRDEQFDSSLTRRTVGDILMGLYDDSLYGDQVLLRTLRKNLSDATSEYASLKSALSNSGVVIDIKELKARQDSIKEELDRIESALTQSSNLDLDVPSQDDELQNLALTLRMRQKEQHDISVEFERLKLDHADSTEFVESLKFRLSALEDSAATEEALGQMLLNTCPECFQAVPHVHEEGHCSLCGQTVSQTGRRERLNRMRHELTTQIHESLRFLEQREIQISKTKTNLDSATIELESLQGDYNIRSQTIRTSRDHQMDALFQAKGALTQEQKSLLFQIQLVEKLIEARKRANATQAQISIVEDRIKNALQRQSARRIEATATIEKIARDFLHKDLPREEAFKLANDVAIDFDRNLTEVDGRVNFSASSITYLRSSANFALFLAALMLPFFRYPRFILNDNIEDKGMEERRSQNFQRLVVSRSEASQITHQIIFTTSMIAPELETPQYCVGERYTIQNKTLRFGLATI